MFNFKNIGKFFSYDWKTLFKSIVPKGNKTKMEEADEKNIINGSILKIIGVVLEYVALMGIAVYIVVKTYSIVYGSSITGFAFREAITGSIGKWIVDILIASIFPIAVIIYTKVMKGKEQNGWPIFIALIITLIQTAYLVYLMISFFIDFLVSPLFVLVGLVSIFAMFLGNIHTSIGCIEFLKKQVSAYVPANGEKKEEATPTETKEETATEQVAQTTETPVAPVVTETPVEPVSPTPVEEAPVQETPVTETPVEPVPQTPVEEAPVSTVYCSNCGNEVPVGTAYCSKCGNQINS